jgi:serine/threonine protein kinase
MVAFKNEVTQDKQAGITLEREFYVMICIEEHQNIVNCINFIENVQTNEGPKNYLALKFAPNGVVLTYLNLRGKQDDKWIRFFLRQMIEGLLHIWNKDFCHLDVKCENMLLDADLNLMISDFGLA